MVARQVLRRSLLLGDLRRPEFVEGRLGDQGGHAGVAFDVVVGVNLKAETVARLQKNEAPEVATKLISDGFWDLRLDNW